MLEIYGLGLWTMLGEYLGSQSPCYNPMVTLDTLSAARESLRKSLQHFLFCKMRIKNLLWKDGTKVKNGV